jgi:3-dehydroquinate synthase
MRTVIVKLGERSYRIQIESGLLDRIGESVRTALGNRPQRAIIVSNPTVDSLYGRRVKRSLGRADFRVEHFLIGDGERFKTLRTAEQFYTFLIEKQVERKDAIIALGGGVVGDLAGFVAATYLRGLSYIQVPTTLLAQIDSSVGGKTAVNHRLGKNLIGAFHQPSLVVIDPSTLGSLPPRQVRAGLFEAIKYAVIRDRSLFEYITGQIERLKQLDSAAISHLIARSCQIKADVVASDERESGLRRILNFGHTIGHALEVITHYRRFQHGEAVGHGMRVASHIAERLGLLAPCERQAIDEAIAQVGNLPRADDLALDAIMLAIGRDKKAEAGRIAFVLPVEIGSVVIKSDVPPQVIRSALKDALSAPKMIRLR